ncbi:MAG: MTH895/ArsE family thioredoxin-like protein [bacterium]
MIKIQIFGSGCEKCTKLYATVEKVVQQHGLDATLEKISDIEAITAAGVMMTPAVGVDGKIVSSGKVLSESDVLRLLAPEHAKPCECHGEVSRDKPNRVKQLISAVLIGLVLGSLGIMIMRESKRPVAPAQSPLNQAGTTVYYFHGNQRCFSCNRIESLTLKAIEGKGCNFKAVNLDEPANEHFVKDFQLDTRVVVIQHNGTYKKMENVWGLVGGKEADFIKYIQDGLPKKSE